MRVAPVSGYQNFPKPNAAVGAVSLTDKQSQAFANIPQLATKNSSSCKKVDNRWAYRKYLDNGRGRKAT